MRSSSDPNRASRSRAGCERIPVSSWARALAAIRSLPWERARGGDDLLGARRSDAAPWCLHGAPERLRVGRVGQQREVGDRVAHLGALIQAEAAEHAVRDPGRGERVLDRSERVAGAGEHEDLRRRQAGGERVGDHPRHPRRLAALVAEALQLELPAGAAHRGQRLRGPLGVVAHARDGGVQDLGARAEVGAEHDLPVAGVALAEAQDVARLGAAEAVDQLVLVADRGQVAGRPGEQLEQRGLRLVGVLQLVDDQPAPARAQVREPLRLLAQQPHREHEQVIERPRVAALELALARPPHGGDQRAGRGRERAVERVRGQQPVLGHADLVLELGRRRPAAALERLRDLAAPAVGEQPCSITWRRSAWS